MPVMNGKDCLMKLKATKDYRDIPVIIYTTTSNKIELEEYLKIGAHDYIIKDHSFQGIKKSLKKVLLN
jgi:CheY-like chemotaxis protein